MATTVDPQEYDLDWLVPGKTVYRIYYGRYSRGAGRISELTVDRLTKTLAIMADSVGTEYRYNRTYRGQHREWKDPDPIVLVEYGNSGYSNGHSYVVPPGHPRLEKAKVERIADKIKTGVKTAAEAVYGGRELTIDRVTALRDAAQAWLDAQVEL